jgi:imidazolonepropionase
LAQGVTCAEVKSGYGLSLEAELKMLRVVRRLNALQHITLLPTLLCAHALPPEQPSRAAYLDLCVEEILPAVAAEKLAVFCDAFCEQGAFTVEETRRMLEAGARHGLIPRLHADQLTAGGGAELAAALSASSADHLEHVSPAGMEALARAGVSALLIPITTFILRQRPYAPGRALRELGINVALGTNVNPGTGMSENLGLTLSLACLESGLTAAEAYYGMTRGAALALRQGDAGKLTLGGPADLVVFSCASHRHLPYHLGVPHARVVIKAGKPVFRTDLAPCADRA